MPGDEREPSLGAAKGKRNGCSATSPFERVFRRLGTVAVLLTFLASGASAQQAAPTVSDVSITSRPASGDTYELGEVIVVRVRFDRAVDVRYGGRFPQLALAIGTQMRGVQLYSTSGRTDLQFRYTVQSSDSDTDGISIGANALTLNDSTIRVSGGTTDAALGLGTHAITDAASHKVDGSRETAPSVSHVLILFSPASGTTYELGEQISAAVSFDRAVDVTGSPRLALTVGAQTRQMSYAAAVSSEGVLRFRYTIQSADRDTDGVSFGANALTLNGATIRTAGGTLNATLGTNATANYPNHKVDGSLETAPTVINVFLSSVGRSSSDTYQLADTVYIGVAFDRRVDVTGTPQLALTVGARTRQASYYASTEQRRLWFSYTVQTSDADADGISIGASALTLNGGAIRIAGGTANAALGLGTHAIANSTSHKVNGSLETAPVVDDVVISSSGRSSGDSYWLGDRISVSVYFDRAVGVTGTPQLALTIGAQTRQASYSHGSGGRNLWFHYTVQSSDVDTDGISIGASALTLNDGTIRIAGGTTNAALGLGTHTIANSANHKVDGSVGVPTVSGVSISNPASGDTFQLGEFIDVSVTFDREMYVTGSPRLALTIGTQTRQARYARSFPSWSTLVFRYTVQSSDMDTDGISIGAGALTLNGGAIRRRYSTVNASLGLGTYAIADATNHKVDGSVEAAPAVNDVSVTSSPASGDTYELGERIVVLVTFDRQMDVTGSPQLALTIGTQTRQARYTGCGGDACAYFAYIVQSSDSDTDGISIGASALTLNSGTIKVAGGTTNAALGLGIHAIANSSDHKVNGSLETAPVVSGVQIRSGPPSGDTYELADRITVRVTFDRAVNVTGTPQLALAIGTQTRQASYRESTGGRYLWFRYTVQSSDSDADGISIGASALTLNGGTIKTAGGTMDAALGLGTYAIANSANHKVDGSPRVPAVSAVSITRPVSGDTYELGEEILVDVTFDSGVDVRRGTGNPQLALTIGTQTRQASYFGYRSYSTHTFNYYVQASDSDADGISIGVSALTLNGGTIKVRGGTTDATLGLGVHAIANSANHKVDGSVETAPAVSFVGFRYHSGDTYRLGEEVRVSMYFDRAVNVTGSPQLALTIGTQTRQASYSSGDGTRFLEFRYTVQSSDSDTDGISIGASALTLNSGTIRIAGGTTNAMLGLGTHAIANSAGHKVDGTPRVPAVSGVSITSSPASGDTYELGESISVSVTFDRAVDLRRVTGWPQLALNIGTQTRQAIYSGRQATRVFFRYIVQSSDSDANGISIGASALTLNGATIKVRGGTTDAALGLGTHAVADATNHKVNGSRETAPAVTEVVIYSPDTGDTFELGETIGGYVAFDRAVEVTGRPRLALTIGTQTRQASYDYYWTNESISSTWCSPRIETRTASASAQVR